MRSKDEKKKKRKDQRNEEGKYILYQMARRKSIGNTMDVSVERREIDS
jgi:hypothetical protein